MLHARNHGIRRRAEGEADRFPPSPSSMRASNGTDGSVDRLAAAAHLDAVVVELLMPIATFRSLRTSSRKPSMLMIVSPSCKPPSSTELPSLMLATVVVIKPLSVGACTANSRMTKPMRKIHQRALLRR